MSAKETVDVVDEAAATEGAVTCNRSQNTSQAQTIAGHLATTEISNIQMYFHYYGRLANQANMLQDLVRTRLYRQVCLSNPSAFQNSVVMDVGAGSGILSFFALEAGARHVLAIEASNAATAIETLRPQEKRLTVIRKPVEAVEPAGDLAEAIPGVSPSRRFSDYFPIADVLISEPLGTFLFNERMVESYLYARDWFLKPGGCMFPNKARLYMSLFSDAGLYSEVLQKTSFWHNTDFCGIDLNPLVSRVLEESLEQPILDYIDRNCLVGTPAVQSFDFATLDRHALQHMKFEISTRLDNPVLVHGIVGWFEADFDGPNARFTLPTGPADPPTHWQQIRFLLRVPLAVNPGQVVAGTLEMAAHCQQSYYINIRLHIEGTNIRSESARIDLRDPEYRWYNQQAQHFQSSLTRINTATTIGTPLAPTSGAAS